MNKKEFKKRYSAVRGAFAALATMSVDLSKPKKYLDHSYSVLYSGLKQEHDAVQYAFMNKFKNTIYPLSNHRWAAKNNCSKY